jgi:hypothetical protein
MTWFYLSHVPSSGNFLLIINVIIKHTHLSRVHMEEGSGFNILYPDTLDQMKIMRSSLRPTEAPFYGIIHEA